MVAHVIGFLSCAAEVNAFAVGLPAVFWHQQGFLDLVAGTDYPAIATSASEFEDWNKVIVFCCGTGSLKCSFLQFAPISADSACLMILEGHESMSNHEFAN